MKEMIIGLGILLASIWALITNNKSLRDKLSREKTKRALEGVKHAVKEAAKSDADATDTWDKFKDDNKPSA